LRGRAMEMRPEEGRESGKEDLPAGRKAPRVQGNCNPIV
jgi:hypothetical protein